MGKRAPVQGWPFALVHACAANTHQHCQSQSKKEKPSQVLPLFSVPERGDCHSASQDHKETATNEPLVDI